MLLVVIGDTQLRLGVLILLEGVRAAFEVIPCAPADPHPKVLIQECILVVQSFQ